MEFHRVCTCCNLFSPGVQIVAREMLYPEGIGRKLREQNDGGLIQINATGSDASAAQTVAAAWQSVPSATETTSFTISCGYC
jgi:hypothetical protein